MRLLRYGEPGREKPGLLDSDGTLRALGGEVDDIAGATLLPASIDRLRALDPASLPIVEGSPRRGPCVGGTGKFLCIGLNYSDHAAEMSLSVPEHPVLFMKATSAIAGPDDTVRLPRGASTGDWEIELGVVIGKPAKYVSASEALEHVAGYCICNDISERTFQQQLGGQWTKGKSCDTFGPIGPWLVTPDEVGDPQQLDLSLQVNGVRRQRGNTRTMIFTVAQIIEHLSQLFTLHPGDIISTGTPPGVGMGTKPEPIYLKPGDTMQLSIDKLGTQTQRVATD